MLDHIRVLVLAEDGGIWKKHIPRTLDAYAEVVGGWVDRILLAPDVALYIDPEGAQKMRTINWNATAIVGGPSS